MAKAKDTRTKDAKRDRRLEAIAREHLDFETLEERRSDSLDFREVSVWGVLAALREAYAAGYEQARSDIEQANRK